MEQLPKKRLQPKKAEFRMRAHCNPFNDVSFNFPLTPKHVNWSLLYNQNEKIFCNTLESPMSFPTQPVSSPQIQPEIIDVGCGFGGLLFGLSSLFPDTRILGMEIRNKVTNYVAKKIWASRIENPGKVISMQFWNISVLRANAMKNLTNYCAKDSLNKMFFCFPDPNFKKSHYRRRIINSNLLGDYCYMLKPGGKIYAITDVLQLHEWHLEQLSTFPVLAKVPDEECKADPCIEVILKDTEEGKKVTRNRGQKFWCVFRKI